MQRRPICIRRLFRKSHKLPAAGLYVRGEPVTIRDEGNSPGWRICRPGFFWPGPCLSDQNTRQRSPSEIILTTSRRVCSSLGKHHANGTLVDEACMTFSETANRIFHTVLDIHPSAPLWSGANRDGTVNHRLCRIEWMMMSAMMSTL